MPQTENPILNAWINKRLVVALSAPRSPFSAPIGEIVSDLSSRLLDEERDDAARDELTLTYLDGIPFVPAIMPPQKNYRHA